ncbi:hypothetical protein GCM10011362_29640 [Marinobacter halophilus]|nr:hypothetical protein GCM10011362_29640 [Marinobacter halophilus]
MRRLIRHHLKEHYERDEAETEAELDRDIRRAYFQGRLLQCRQVSFTIDNKRQPNYTDWMRHRIDSQQGKEIHSHRMSVVEPVFGNIGTNKRLNRLSL